MDITRNGNGVSAIVEYDYEAKARDELNLKKGAIITNIKVQPGGWWEGCLAGGLTGMFPDNFVRVLEPNDKNPVVLRDSSATQNRRCKVIYSYRENKGDELTLAVGDIVEVLEEVEEGWWRGALHGRVGVFPSNFVEAFDFGGSPKSANRKSLTNSFNNGSLNKSRSSLNSSREDLDIGHPDAPSLPPKPVRELCKVLFGYQPHNDDELKLVEGDIITILSKELPDKGWWKGESKGKIGVFPDNFVELLQPEVSSPIKEQQKPERPPPAKILVNKTPNLNNSNSNSNSTSRKDSFGSKDSLNDSGITNTPPVFSNVAAQRRSLQNKNMNIDVNVSPLGGLGSGGGGSAEKPPRKAFDMKTPADIRKSLESLVDDKQKNVTPPPVVGKKPNVPIKKSPSITTVTNSLFSGLKQKVKSVESKLSSGSSHDSMDGIGSSRAMGSQIADNGEKGITGEKLRQGDSELLDQVERTTKLHDMRANRAKAPKRRPPTSNQSNTNSIVIDDDQLEDLNTASPPESPKSEVPGALDDEMAKPKPRGWAKNRAPWMDELKASQMKKTSPNVEPRKINSTNNEHHAERPPFAIASNRKSLESANSMNHSNSTSITSNGSSNFDMRANSIDVVKSSSAHHHETNSVMTKSMSSIGTTKISLIDNNNSNNLNNLNNNNINSNNNNNINTNNNNNLKNDTKTDELIMNNNNNNMNNVNNNNVRPASVNIRNRSISPIARMSSIGGGGGSVVGGNGVGKSVTSNQLNNSTTMSSTTNHVHSESHVGKTTIASTISTSSSSGDDNLNVRVSELETRVLALEKLVTSQKNTIDNLAKKFQDESDKVKTLKTELEKYAQCVTQV